MYILCFAQVKSCVNLFTSPNGKLKGYGKANMTPYMHAMVYHVSHFIKIHKGIKKFTGQVKLLRKIIINAVACEMELRASPFENHADLSTS